MKFGIEGCVECRKGYGLCFVLSDRPVSNVVSHNENGGVSNLTKKSRPCGGVVFGEEKISLSRGSDSDARDGIDDTHLSEKCLLLEDAGPYSDREQTFETSAGKASREDEELVDLTLREELQRNVEL
jgi:hypothetical protein